MDALTLAVIQAGLTQVCNEMDLAFSRSAFSPVIAEADVRRWVARLARDGDGPRTLARRLSAWRGWFDFLARAGQVSSNPARGVRAPKRPRRLPKARLLDATPKPFLAAPGRVMSRPVG